MKNYSLTEALKIFCNVDASTSIHLKFHFHEKNHERHPNSQSWIKAFFKHKLLGIMKQEYNKFKLCYNIRTKGKKTYI